MRRFASWICVTTAWLSAGVLAIACGSSEDDDDQGATPMLQPGAGGTPAAGGAVATAGGAMPMPMGSGGMITGISGGSSIAPSSGGAMEPQPMECPASADFCPDCSFGTPCCLSAGSNMCGCDMGMGCMEQAAPDAGS